MPSQENCLFDAHRWTRERWGEEHGFTVKKKSKRLLLTALMMGCSFGAAHDAFAEEAARTPAEAENSQRTAQENADSEYHLPDLTVLGDRKTFRGGMIERKSTTGILGEKDSLELPFSVTTVSQKAIETFSTPQSGVMDTLSLVPSVRASSSKSVHSVTIRGFQQNGYSMYINGIPGAMSSGNLPYCWIENATVVAGPNLGVNGTNISDTIGGSINFRSKRAQAKDNTDVRLSYNGGKSFEQGVDIGWRFGADKAFGLRVAANHIGGETVQEDKELKQDNIFVNFDHQGKRSTTNLMLGYSRIKYEGGGDGFSVGNLTVLPKAPDASKSYTPSWLYHTYKDTWIILNHEQKLNDHVTAYINFGHHKFDYDKYYEGTPKLTSNDGDFTINAEYWPLGHTRIYFGTGLRGDFQTGDVKHEYIIGFDKNWVNRFSGGGNLWSGTGNLYRNNSWASVPLPDYQPPLQFKQQMTGYHLVDTMKFMDDRLQLTLGLHGHKSSYTRVGQKRQDSDATCPTFALSYKFTPEIMGYVSHSESFNAGTLVSGASYKNKGEVLPPAKTKQDEIGVKIKKGDFVNTLSLFKIRKANTIDVMRPDGKYRLNDGEQENTGFEWAFTGKIGKRLDLVGGMMYLDAKQSKTKDGANDGKAVGGTSKFSGTIGAVYHVDPAWSLIGRVSYLGRADIKNETLSVPASWKVDLGASYETKMGTTPVTLTLMCYNVTGKDYWIPVAGSDGLQLSAPRSVSFAANFEL